MSTNQYLQTNDFLVVPLLGYLIMQGDGNVCWYKGTGPGDTHGLIWCASTVSKPQGDYFLIMQGDGNLCAYRGTGPSDNQGLVWETGTPGDSGDYSFMICLYDVLEIGQVPAIVVGKGVCKIPGMFGAVWSHIPGL